jgi:hypothetical protein
MTTNRPEEIHARKMLIALRFAARRQVGHLLRMRKLISEIEAAEARAVALSAWKAAEEARVHIKALLPEVLEIMLKIVEVGDTFQRNAPYIDLLPREFVLRALCVNESHWNTEAMLRYGSSVGHIVYLLNLENSATPDTGMATRPLSYCAGVAMKNKATIDPKFGKVYHNILNEQVDGALGEWRTPTLLERLGVNYE